MLYRLCSLGTCQHLYATDEEGDYQVWVRSRSSRSQRALKRAVLEQSFRKQRKREVLPAEENPLLIKQICFCPSFNAAGNIQVFVQTRNTANWAWIFRMPTSGFLSVKWDDSFILHVTKTSSQHRKLNEIFCLFTYHKRSKGKLSNESSRRKDTRGQARIM